LKEIERRSKNEGEDARAGETPRCSTVKPVMPRKKGTGSNAE